MPDISAGSSGKSRSSHWARRGSAISISRGGYAARGADQGTDTHRPWSSQSATACFATIPLTIISGPARPEETMKNEGQFAGKSSHLLEKRFDYRALALALAPAAAALCYPFLLKGFHAVVGTPAETPSTFA